MSTETVSPQATLFEKVAPDKKLRFFIAYLSGRLTSNDALAQDIVDIYNEWKEMFPDA